MLDKLSDLLIGFVALKPVTNDMSLGIEGSSGSPSAILELIL